MTVEKLKTRIQNAVNDLRLSANSLDSISSISLPTDCQTQIREFKNIADRLDKISPIIDAREYARQILQNLRDSDTTSDLVEFQGMQIPFSVARLLGFQSYISVTWSICDSITPEIAPFICLESLVKNRSQPAQLLTHFLDTKHTSYYCAFFLRESYGWPIGISYAIRNFLIHDGGIVSGENFFETTNKADGFKISEKGWSSLQTKVKKSYNLSEGQTRITMLSWASYQNDLLELLELCHRELDDALGCLIGWSVGTAKLQAQFLLERDDI